MCLFLAEELSVRELMTWWKCNSGCVNWRYSWLLRTEVSGGARNCVEAGVVDLKLCHVKCQKRDTLAL